MLAVVVEVKCRPSQSILHIKRTITNKIELQVGVSGGDAGRQGVDGSGVVFSSHLHFLLRPQRLTSEKMLPMISDVYKVKHILPINVLTCRPKCGTCSTKFLPQDSKHEHLNSTSTEILVS